MSNVAAGKDTDDEGEKLNDVEKALGKLDIKLRDSIGEWRNFEEVLDEIAGKWQDFSEVQRSQIATALAGTRQQETFRALMNNYDQVKTLAGVAADSIGTASKRMETYTESVEAKTNQLKATWEEFVMSLNQSESYKNFLDLCMFILKHFSEMTAVVIAFIAAWKFDTISKKTSALMTLLTNFKGDLFLVKEAFLGAKVSGESFSNTLVGLAGKEKAAAIQTKLLKVELLALLAILMIVYEWQRKANEEMVKQNKQTTEEVGAINEQRKSLSQLIADYQEAYTTTDNLTERKSKLQEIEKQLVDLYGSEADGVNLVSGAYEDQIEVLRQLEKQSIHNQATKLRENKNNTDKALNLAPRKKN